MVLDFKEISNNYLSQLEEIESSHQKIISCANKAILLSQKTLNTFKKLILKNGFDTDEEEIKFFKYTKQISLKPLIYYSEIRSFELQFPKADKSTQLKFVRKKTNKLNRFFLYNLDFGQYVNSGATHFDKEYYTRNHLDTFRITTSKFYFQDLDFCTPRDMLLGKFKAYTSLINYMDQKKHFIKNRVNGNVVNVKSTEKIPWPFTNTDWVELLYSLCAAGMAKQNGLSIIKISKILQEVFDFTPKEIYKTFQDIKNRKNSRTLFLDQLTSSLLSEMDKSEE